MTYRGRLELHSFSSSGRCELQQYCLVRALCRLRSLCGACISDIAVAQSLAKTQNTIPEHTLALASYTSACQPRHPSFSAPSTTKRASPLLSPPRPPPPHRRLLVTHTSSARMRLALTHAYRRHGGLRHHHHVVPRNPNAHAERAWSY